MPVLLRTFSGKLIDLTDPRINDISIVDIAHALSNICRFGGHTSGFYSVAQHSVEVAEVCPPELKGIGFAHDFAEAYMGDIITSLKGWLSRMSCGAIEGLEENLLECIFSRFQLDIKLLPEIKKYDLQLLNTEGTDLVTKWDGTGLPDVLPIKIVPWDHEVIVRKFLTHYNHLRNSGRIN